MRPFAAGIALALRTPGAAHARRWSPWRPRPTPRDDAGAWHPDYSRGFAGGVCTDASPVPDGVATYKSRLDCCERAYAGQASGACLGKLKWISPTPSGNDAASEVWYPDYSRGFAGGVCVDALPVPNGIVTYASRLDCCERAYAGQASGACLGQIQLNSPTPSGDSASALEVWYPDYSRGFAGGVCIDALPVPNGIVTYASRPDCCERAYAGQASGACFLDYLGSVETLAEATLPVVWFPVHPDQTCVSATEVPTIRNRRANGYETQLECCIAEYGRGVDPGGSDCSAGSPHPLQTSWTGSGGADVWHPDYSLGWNGGTCTNVLPVPDNGIATYASRDACCQTAFAGQPSGACLGLISEPEPIVSVASLSSDPEPIVSVASRPCPERWRPDPIAMICTREGGRSGKSNKPSASSGSGKSGKSSSSSRRGKSNKKCASSGRGKSDKDSVFESNVECCRDGIALQYGFDPSICLATIDREFVEDIVQITATLTNIRLPPTEQGLLDLTAELENVFFTIVNTLLGPEQVALNAIIDPASITAPPGKSSKTSKSTKAANKKRRRIQAAERGILVVADVKVRSYCSTTAGENCENSLRIRIGQVRRQLRRRGFNNEDVDVVILDPTPSPTEAPSSPPTELSRRTLARQIDLQFGPKNQMSLENDRNKLRTMLQETFSNAGDVEDIVLNMYVDSNLSSDSVDDQSSLSAIDNDSGHHEIDVDLDDPIGSLGGGAIQCKCVDCKQDKDCGGLWKGRKFADDRSPLDRTTLIAQPKIHVVVSHCMHGLGWMNDYTKGFDLASIHVISKCGQEVIGAPQLATIEVQSTTGGWDHTYAYYITTVLSQRVKEGEEDSVVIFLKDDISVDTFDRSWHANDFEGLVREAASDLGFGCGINSGGVNFGPHNFDLSAYHETTTLHSFSVNAPSNNLAVNLGSSGGGDDPIVLSNEFKSLGLWWNAMGIPPPPEAVRVCYGGMFAGSVQNIFKTNESVWKNMEKSLSRGNTTQERHYAERSWALLMTAPLEPYQSVALLEKADGVHVDQNSYHGALLRRPKLYIHIGAQGTLSTEVLAESLVQNIETLEVDGYKVAVHGKFEAGRYGFPDIDRLGACMWDEMSKSMFPDHMSEAKVCPEQLLPTLSKYMNNAFKESHDMIMLNPWLVREGTAGALSIYLDPVWDASIVIYYRRFFEWLRLKFYGWRQDLWENSLSPDKIKIPKSSFRYIDFIREYCKQLFYGKDALEDGFPLRPLLRYLGGSEKRLSESDFNPTTNFDYEELTAPVLEYAYHAAKQYHAQSRFRHGIRIVNSHDNHGIETTFYCHVLHGAANACEHAVQREHQIHETVDDKISLQANATLALDPSMALEDIAVHGYIEGYLSFDPLKPKKKFRQQILLWVEMLSEALQKNAVPIEQLPTECLYKYERRRLLEASLAYERSMLPDFFASPRGGSNLKREFESSKFCSVDTDALLSDPNWDFLFEAASKFTVPTQRKAFVHIGAARTNGLLVERMLTMDADQSALKEDLYVVFSGHGHLAPCVWSDAERQIIAEDTGKDLATCPTSFLSHFNDFLSNAMATGNDVIIYDEWLSVPSSETGLARVLGDNFDPVIVMHYRRFFDWVLASYHEWRLNIEIATVQSMRGRVRLVDFIRLFCSHLFASDISHSERQGLLDLLDLPDYTYNLWKQYTKIPAFKDNNVKLVNYHDGHIVKSFYCDVLNSKKACKLELDRLVPYGSANSPTQPLISKYEDMAMGLNWSTGVGSKERFFTLGENYKDKMDQRGLVEDDLPKECLSEAEKSMLLMVSLEYERIMLPDFHSSGGGKKMREHFGALVANDTFCSVDLDKLIDSLEWKFLFEVSNEVLY